MKTFMILSFLASVHLTFDPLLAAPSKSVNMYSPWKNNLCEGYPQARVESLKGTCLGIMVHANQGMRMPRYGAQLSQGELVVSDMGSWDYGKGTVWLLQETTSSSGLKQTKIINLFPKTILNLPNGIAVDPQDWVYIGTPNAILRFKPYVNGVLVLDPPLETVIDDFGTSLFRQKQFANKDSYQFYTKKQPKLRNKHPLVNFVFDQNFRHLYVNIGAPSDACLNGFIHKNSSGFCEQTEGIDTTAAIFHYELDLTSNGPKILHREVFARGLRNSMALALHAQSGNLLQGENSRDYDELDRPSEEINWVQLGSHYGWPYCHSKNEVSAEFQTIVKPIDCAGQRYQPPRVLLPPHSAPLGMAFYQDQLFVGLHGYRETGHQIISLNVDSQSGLPSQTNTFTPVVFNWTLKTNVRPQGAPVGLLPLQNGSLLIIEDKNKSLLVLGHGQTYSELGNLESPTTPTPSPNWSEAQLAQLDTLRTKYFTKTCSRCHEDVFSASMTTKQVASALYAKGFLSEGLFEETLLFYKLDPKMSLMPPPGSEPGLTEAQRLEMIKVLDQILK